MPLSEEHLATVCPGTSKPMWDDGDGVPRCIGCNGKVLYVLDQVDRGPTFFLAQLHYITEDPAYLRSLKEI